MSDIEDLQTRIAFQEDTIAKLDDALGYQQREIMALQDQVRELREQIQQLEDNLPESPQEPPRIIKQSAGHGVPEDLQRQRLTE